MKTNVFRWMQLFSLIVILTAATLAVASSPIITSLAPNQVDESGLFQYQIIAEGTEGEMLVYELLPGAPSGMHIDNKTGLIQWRTDYNSAGNYEISIRVTGAAGLAGEQTFTLHVNDVALPPFTYIPSFDLEPELLFTFTEGRGQIVQNRASIRGSERTHLVISEPEKVSWNECGGLTIQQGTLLQSLESPRGFVKAVKQSGESTIEAWVLPKQNSTANDLARIFGISADYYNRNFTIGQFDQKLQVRYRTTSTGSNGSHKVVQTEPGNIANQLLHIIYTKGLDQVGRLYVNGIEVASELVPSLPSNWDEEYRINVANEALGGRDWLGELHMLAAFSSALSPEQVSERYNSGIYSTCNQAPIVRAEAYPVPDISPLTFAFDASASLDIDGQIVSYRWTLPSGMIKEGKKINHTLSIAGVYRVGLIVEDDLGATASIELDLETLPHGPITEGRILYYDFEEAQGSIISDTAGVLPAIDLQILNPTNTRWLSCGGLDVHSPTILRETTSSERIAQAIKETNAFTIEAWLKPDNLSQTGPARIATYSQDSTHRNFTLGQVGNDYQIRFRTTATNSSGLNPHLESNSSIAKNELTHLVYTRNEDGLATLYLDGAAIKSEVIPSTTSNWNSSYEFAIGDELTGGRAWLGELFELAIYQRSLSKHEVYHNYHVSLGAVCGDDISSGAPSITSAPITQSDELGLYQYHVIASDPEGDSLSFRLGGNVPAGMTIDPSSGLLSWQTDYESEGNYRIEVIVEDPEGRADTQEFTLTISNVNRAPVITSAPVLNGAEGTIYQYILSANDPDGDALLYSLTSGPLGMGMDPNSGVVSWVPNFDQSGDHAVTIEVFDSAGLRASQSFMLSIKNTNAAPLATPQNLSLLEDTTVNIVLGGSDVDGDVLQFQLASQPTYGALTGAGATWQYTPSKDFNGEDSYSFVAVDGTHTSLPATIILHVEAVNDAPVIMSTPNLSINLDTTYNYQVEASDIDGDSLTYRVVEGPSGLTVSESGLVEWVANSTGTKNIMLGVHDGTVEITQLISLNVVSANQAPVFTSNPILVSYDLEPYSYQVAANDADNDTLSYSLLEAPEGMTIDSSSGKISWLAALGQYAISAQVEDGSGGSSEQNFTLTIVESTPEVTYKGTRFWLAFAENANAQLGDPDYKFFISSEEATSGEISIPFANMVIPFSVSPGVATEISLDDATRAIVNEESRRLGANNASILVSAADDITLVIVNNMGESTDGTLVFPEEALGTDYLLSSYNAPVGNGLALEQFLIVAQEDNTNIQVTPKASYFRESWNGKFDQPTERRAGESFTISLNRGDTFQERAVAANTINGTSLKSDKPIAVFSGTDCTFVTFNAACDHLVEQLPAIDSWGTEFYTVPFKGRFKGDVVRLMSSQDANDIILNGIYEVSLDEGQFYEVQLAEASHITSDFPILVTQFATSARFDSDERGGALIGDPSMLIVPPAERYLERYNTSTLSERIETHHLNLSILTSATDTVQIGGNTLSEGSWSTIGESGYSYAQLDVAAGNQLITASEPFGVTFYGWGVFESYGYNGGASFGNQRVADQLVLSVDNTSPQIGSQVCVNIQALDVNNLPITQRVLDLEIQGYVPLKQKLLTNGLGQSSICYVGTSIGDQQVTVSAGAISKSVFITWEEYNSSENLAPVITSRPSLLALPDSNYFYDVIAIDVNGDTLNYALKTAPIGMSIRPQTGQISWTTPVDLADALVEIKVTDGNGGIATQAYRVRSKEDSNRAPAFVSTPVLQASVGSPYVYEVISRDIDNELLVYNVLGGPRGVTFSRTNAQNSPTTFNVYSDNVIADLEWTPTQGDIGQHDIIIGATDINGATNTQAFTLTVMPNQPPAFTSSPILNATTGHLYRYQMQSNDPEGGEVSYELVNGPTGLTVESQLNGFVEWRPTSGQTGNQDVTIRVIDTLGASSEQSFTISTQANALPVFTSTPVDVVVENQLYLYILGTSDADNDQVSLNLLQGPEGMEVNGASSRSLVWSPGSSDVGTYDVIVSADDGAGGVTNQSFTLSVVPNSPPFIDFDKPATFVTGRNYRLPFHADDLDPASNFSVTLSGIDGTLQRFGRSNFFLNWSPTSADVGTQTIVLTATDSLNASQTEIYTVEVVANRAPEWVSAPSLLTVPGQLYRYDYNAIDPDDDNVRYQVLESPPGTAIRSDYFAWVATEAQFGLQQFRVRAFDDFGGESIQTFSINVADALSFTLYPGSITASANELLEFTVKASHPNLLGPAYSLDQAPAGVSIQANGTVTWTPTNDDIGSLNVVISASTNDGAQTSVTIPITVTEQNLAPVVTVGSVLYFRSGEETRYQIDAIDPNGDELSYRLVNAPFGLKIDHTGLITWQPHSSQIGQETFELVAEDDRGASSTVAVNVDVGIDRVLMLVNKPLSEAFVNQPYAYRTSAIAQHGFEVTIQLTNGPLGMEISPDTSFSGYYELNWMPDEASCQYDVTLLLTDVFGNTEQVIYTIDVYNAPKKLNRFQCAADDAFCALR